MRGLVEKIVVGDVIDESISVPVVEAMVVEVGRSDAMKTRVLLDDAAVEDGFDDSGSVRVTIEEVAAVDVDVIVVPGFEEVAAGFPGTGEDPAEGRLLDAAAPNTVEVTDPGAPPTVVVASNSEV